jgi:O-antigen/teichoic acid export membrane protein
MGKALGWQAIIVLGVATLLNQVFHYADVLLLGAMSNATEVGLYSAAYKILFLIFGAYYLLTQSAYPLLARLKDIPHTRRRLFKYAGLAAGVGALITVLLWWSGDQLLKLIYGTSGPGAAELLRVLSLAFPLEFAVAFLGTALVSWGRNATVMATTGVAAVFNVLVNLWVIPRWGAAGAAWTTIASYCLLFMSLAVVFVGVPRGGLNSSPVHFHEA